MTKKQLAIVVVLWVLTAALLTTGIVLSAIGLRTLLGGFLDAAFAPLSGESSGSILDYEADPKHVTMAVVGAACLLAGSVLFTVSYRMQRSFGRDKRSVPSAQSQAQAILRDIGLSSENRAPQSTAERYCVRCGRPIDSAEYAFCPYCGAKAVEIEQVQPTAPRKCMYCGGALDENEEVCPVCGHKVK